MADERETGAAGPAFEPRLADPGLWYERAFRFREAAAVLHEASARREGLLPVAVYDAAVSLDLLLAAILAERGEPQDHHDLGRMAAGGGGAAGPPRPGPDGREGRRRARRGAAGRPRPVLGRAGPARPLPRPGRRGSPRRFRGGGRDGQAPGTPGSGRAGGALLPRLPGPFG